MKIKIDSLDTIHEAAKEFLQNMGDGKVFAFYGKMGAGKTTFVKAICEELGVEDVITSPTFALVNEYTAGDGSPVYHFDFYRIKKLDEVYDMGYEDYFYSGNLCFLEWPELIEELLPEDCTKVTITAKRGQGFPAAGRRPAMRRPRFGRRAGYGCRSSGRRSAGWAGHAGGCRKSRRGRGSPGRTAPRQSRLPWRRGI